MSGTVLVVEDSASAREVVMRLLKREGYNVIGASNALEAMDAMHHAAPDLVLLDVMMPDKDGMTLLEELRQEPQFRELPVILLTALSDAERIDRARELGATDYLVKTRFTYDELLDQVERHVKH